MFKQFIFRTAMTAAVALAVTSAALAQDPVDGGLVELEAVASIPQADGSAPVGASTPIGAVGTFATVENSYFTATATGHCSSRLIDAKVTIRAKKQALFQITSAGLYNSSGGLVTSTGMQGYYNPIWLGSMYPPGSHTFTWRHAAPSGGVKVKFYVSAPSRVVTVAVAASCDT